MLNDFSNKKGIAFWRSWNNLNRTGSSLSSRINGETEGEMIANSFSSYFESVYSGHDTAEHKLLNDQFSHSFSRYYTDHINDSISHCFLSWSEMLDIAATVKLGKSTAGSIRPEHIIHGAPELMCHFHILFNGLLQHNFVPTGFLEGTITPIIKDSQGDVSDTSNYRGITLSCLPAKLFELAIQKKTSHLLGSDELQFRFKSKTSTTHALLLLKTTVEHFNNNGSNVYVAFLDCTKAFDRISHSGLFMKLISRNVPLRTNVLDVLVYEHYMYCTMGV